MMKWYVEYYDEYGFWYLDGSFETMAQVIEYYKSVERDGYELIKVFSAREDER